jgi:hypothetical protein
MTKMTLKIKKSQLAEFVKEMKSAKVRHEPFRVHGDSYDITLFPNGNSLFLVMKYGFDISEK